MIDKKNKFKNIFLFLIYSIFFHLTFISFISHISFNSFVPETTQKKTFSIDLTDSINKEFRNVGIKNGSKINQVMLSDLKQNKPVLGSKNKKVNLKSSKLSDQINKKQSSLKRSIPKEGVGLSTISNLKKSNEGRIIKSFMREPLANYGPGNFSPASRLAQSANLGIHFEIPEGVDISELNESELVFYSFKKRIAQSFINTLFHVYDRFSVSNPQAKIPVGGLSETLTGQLVFDDIGKIKEVKILKGSDDSKTEEFFEEVLDNLRSLPNPPKALINNSNEFVIYFSLIMNG